MAETSPTRAVDELPLATQGTDETAPLTSTDASAGARGGDLPRPFGRYELRGQLGRGGMGVVYLAHDPVLDRLVALKIPRAIEEGDTWRERFRAEARAAANIQHPNICPVFDVGETDCGPYLTMAYVEGETLAARVRRAGRPTIRESVALILTVARAMAEAHALGIVHRDLKPANIMIDHRGEPIVMDFGLALRSDVSDDLRLTLSGVGMGTPSYMPPEQAGGDQEAIGPPSDVYSLGVILNELVTGRVPFEAKTFGKLLAQIERDPPPLPSSLNGDVDAALEAVILTALEKDPARRFSNAGAFADALAAYLHGDRASLISTYGSAAERFRETAPFLPESYGTLSPARPEQRRTGWRVIAAGVFGVALLCVAGVVYVQTDEGELKIELSDPTVKVDVRINGQEVILDPDGMPVKVRAGNNQKLVVSGKDFETVSESFDLKRGGVSVVRVTLQPKVAKARPKGERPKEERPKEEKPKVATKPVAFPKETTLIEIPSWQMLTDASEVEAQKWLNERKKAKHSVLWLDAAQVGDKAVYAAVAATDDRAADWQAILDMPTTNYIKEISERIDMKSYRMIAISGFERDGQLRTTCLLRTPILPTYSTPDNFRPSLDDLKKLIKQYGLKVLSIRPYTDRQGVTVFAAVAARGPDTGEMKLDLSDAELEQFAEAERAAERRLSVVTAYPVEGELKFAAVSVPNPAKLKWAVDTNRTAAGLKEKASGRAESLRPVSVTGCAWDGAVRYCAVWVEEAPKK